MSLKKIKRQFSLHNFFTTKPVHIYVSTKVISDTNWGCVKSWDIIQIINLIYHRTCNTHFVLKERGGGLLLVKVGGGGGQRGVGVRSFEIMIFLFKCSC